jgi:hypothetical protein
MLFALLANAVKPDLLLQLSKIPSLVAHYHHHVNDENEQIGFLDFLVLHYGQNSTHRTAENHDDLPLFFNSTACFVMITNASATPDLAVHFIGYVQPFFAYTDFYSFDKLTSIFQPPQFV